MSKVELPSEVSIWSGEPTPTFIDETLEWRFAKFEQVNDVKNDTEYTVTTTDESSFYYLPHAMISVEYKITKANDAAVDIDDQASLVSNGWSLFESARLRIGGAQISQVIKPGKAAHLKTVVEKGAEWVKSCGANSHTYVDSVSDGAVGMTGFLTAHVASAAAPVAQLLPVNSFYHELVADKVLLGTTGHGITRVQANSKFDPAFQRKVDRALQGENRIFLPLVDVFPILSAMDKVVRGTRVEVNLNKISNVAEALWSFTSGLKLVISRVQLHVPILRGSLSALARMEKQLSGYTVYGESLYLRQIVESALGAGEKTQLLDSRSSRPRRVYVAFQRASRNTDPKLNSLEFDLPDDKTNRFSKVELRANGKACPSLPYDPSKDTYRIVQDMYKIAAKTHDYQDSSIVTADNWAKQHTVFAFDLEATESGSSYESRGNVELLLNYSLSSDALVPYNIYSLVVSEMQANIDNTSGQTKLITL